MRKLELVNPAPKTFQNPLKFGVVLPGRKSEGFCALLALKECQFQIENDNCRLCPMSSDERVARLGGDTTSKTGFEQLSELTLEDSP
mmetsp:Transcript_34891/g.71971  ORF Transcript_34891/g.71971 Transcript_34891/m.71971 type:complete len:87 (-) Transcript_34891:345-605(-)